jgi:hypothetical protein
MKRFNLSPELCKTGQITPSGGFATAVTVAKPPPKTAQGVIWPILQSSGVN